MYTAWHVLWSLVAMYTWVNVIKSHFIRLSLELLCAQSNRGTDFKLVCVVATPKHLLSARPPNTYIVSYTYEVITVNLRLGYARLLKEIFKIMHNVHAQMGDSAWLALVQSKVCGCRTRSSNIFAFSGQASSYNWTWRGECAPCCWHFEVVASIALKKQCWWSLNTLL